MYCTSCLPVVADGTIRTSFTSEMPGNLRLTFCLQLIAQTLWIHLQRTDFNESKWQEINQLLESCCSSLLGIATLHSMLYSLFSRIVNLLTSWWISLMLGGERSGRSSYPAVMQCLDLLRSLCPHFLTRYYAATWNQSSWNPGCLPAKHLSQLCCQWVAKHVCQVYKLTNFQKSQKHLAMIGLIQMGF